MKKFIFVAACIGALSTCLSLALAQDNIKIISQVPFRIVPEYPKPKVNTTPWTVYTQQMNADIPIIILVNKSGHDFAKYSQVNIFVDDNLGIMSHAQGPLQNGKEKVIIPYIRKGGKVTVKAFNGYPSWRSKGELKSGIPMILTYLPHGKVTVNKPYQPVTQ